jgi:hypothetical protein
MDSYSKLVLLFVCELAAARTRATADRNYAVDDSRRVS